MRVLFLSDLETAGGAAIAASRLAQGLALEEVEVLRFFGTQASLESAEPITWEANYMGLTRAVEIGVNALRRILPGAALAAARAVAGERLVRGIGEARFDVLHIHALHNSHWSHRTLARLAPTLPTVWTFHDFWGFSPESYRFRTLDGAEARLKPDGPDRALAQSNRIAYFRTRERLRLIANSRATASYAEACLEMPTRVIPYALPLDLYRPVERAVARQALALPQDALILGFSADTTSEPVKGYRVLEEALRRIDRPEVWAISMGASTVGDRAIGKVNVRALGRVANPRLQAIVYSAADAFVVPSLAEALGQVAMESIASGTPVIGSNVGGIPDVVIPGRSGWLFPVGDIEALKALIDGLARDRQAAARLTDSCRALAESSWELRRQGRDYLEVYRELLR